MAEFDPNIKQVSGPVNVVRMEGRIHGIKKVIYLFMDFHIDIPGQRQCDNIFSKHVKNYFAENFYNLNKTTRQYDFFLETFPTELVKIPQDPNLPQLNYTQLYIMEVRKFFKKFFVYDPEIDKVSISDVLKNVRLHYIDIRDYYIYFFSNKMSELLGILNIFLCHNNISLNDLVYIIDSINVLIEKLKLNVVNTLSEKYDKKDKISVIKSSAQIDKHHEIFKYFINKIITSYKDEEIKKILNRYIDKIRQGFISSIDEMTNIVNKFNDYGNLAYTHTNRLTRDENGRYDYGLPRSAVQKIIIDMIKLFSDIYMKIFDDFMMLMDIYFLRRFLDKDYVTNAIVYTGGWHSRNYIDILVKEFDFRITHVSYAKIDDMEKLTEEIKKVPFNEIEGLLYPPVMHQCSDMTHFPEDFL